MNYTRYLSQISGSWSYSILYCVLQLHQHIRVTCSRLGIVWVVQLVDRWCSIPMTLVRDQVSTLFHSVAKRLVSNAKIYEIKIFRYFGRIINNYKIHICVKKNSYLKTIYISTHYVSFVFYKIFRFCWCKYLPILFFN